MPGSLLCIVSVELLLMLPSGTPPILDEAVCVLLVAEEEAKVLAWTGVDVVVTGSAALVSKIKWPMYIVDWVIFFPVHGDVISIHIVIPAPMFKVPFCVILDTCVEGVHTHGANWDIV
ncbi:hypothetical protein M408DRAFT_6559 [Serendipita vermifera MAFF 305830]|uniref:Secreted protein n=1 Tax=Serendipita vermifera MAFF 305830 TaxID=933852 RepID=A0A0C2XTP8_SERVB|nr:hypothetical protein M408DRAFT_6559 [Serendipita vermifera MAFF 305830]